MVCNGSTHVVVFVKRVLATDNVTVISVLILCAVVATQY